VQTKEYFLPTVTVQGDLPSSDSLQFFSTGSVHIASTKI
jgi:hypothetical protein